MREWDPENGYIPWTPRGEVRKAVRAELVRYVRHLERTTGTWILRNKKGRYLTQLEEAWPRANYSLWESSQRDAIQFRSREKACQVRHMVDRLFDGTRVVRLLRRR